MPLHCLDYCIVVQEVWNMLFYALVQLFANEDDLTPVNVESYVVRWGNISGSSARSDFT